MNSIRRRDFLRISAIAGLAALGAACQSAPAPQAANPGPTSAAAKPGGAADWQALWADLVTAAKAEGTFVVATTSGAAYQNYLKEFEAAFPGIEVQYRVFPTFAQFNPKILAERQAGIYSWDLINHTASETLAPGTVGAASGSAGGGGRGGLDPVKAQLFRPDVLGDSNWVDGSFDAGWLDHDKQFGYSHTANKGGDQLWVNTDKVNPDEIKSFPDLLNPKWKGKIELQDPRVSGDSFVFLTALRLNLGSQGDELMRKLLLDQEPVIATDPRNTAERLIKGAISIASGPRTDTLLPFKQQGLTDKLFLLRLPETAFKQVSSGLWLINNAPHPNATKLFLNWACTQEGSAAYVRNLTTNSRRKDVEPGDSATQLDPKANYKTTMITEDSLEAIAQTKQLAKEILS